MNSIQVKRPDETLLYISHFHLKKLYLNWHRIIHSSNCSNRFVSRYFFFLQQSLSWSNFLQKLQLIECCLCICYIRRLRHRWMRLIFNFIFLLERQNCFWEEMGTTKRYVNFELLHFVFLVLKKENESSELLLN